MAYRMTVTDPRDPDASIDVDYDARRGRDYPEVGWRAPLEIEVDGIDALSIAHQADIIDQIHARHEP